MCEISTEEGSLCGLCIRLSRPGKGVPVGGVLAGAHLTDLPTSKIVEVLRGKPARSKKLTTMKKLFREQQVGERPGTPRGDRSDIVFNNENPLSRAAEKTQKNHAELVRKGSHPSTAKRKEREPGERRGPFAEFNFIVFRGEVPRKKGREKIKTGTRLAVCAFRALPATGR